MKAQLIFLLVGVASVSSAPSSCSKKLPVVDLGYEAHLAISFNENTGLYNFTNIRYAQAPVGDLRFRAPRAPTGRNPDVQIGEQGRICPQAMPKWTLTTAQFVNAWARGNAETFDTTAAVAASEAFLEAKGWPAPNANPNNHTTEDCLFLDVVVPKDVFHGAKKGKKGSPVFVWLHGGAYVVGNKIYDNSGDPSGMIRVSQEDGSDGIVYVSINYRLGALGWLAGSSMEEAGGVPNAALLDQRLALEWVQDNIHLFGGDHDQVTVSGVSAGAGSIVHQMTAYGGRKAPYQRAIPLSTGYVPLASGPQMEDATQTFLGHLGVETVKEARQMSSADLILANAKTIGASQWTSFTFGPTVDGDLVPALPGISFTNGQFDQDVAVMTGHTAHEGPVFSPPNVTTNADFTAYIESLFPAHQDGAVEYMLSELYPEETIDRTLQVIGDIGIACNTDYLRRAYNNQTYNYRFDVAPGIHASDIPYLFYSGPEPEDVDGGIWVGPSGYVQAALARVLQGYVVNFSKFGDPNGAGLPLFPVSGTNQSMQFLEASGVTVRRDTTANGRCAWLQKGPYVY